MKYSKFVNSFQKPNTIDLERPNLAEGHFEKCILKFFVTHLEDEWLGVNER